MPSIVLNNVALAFTQCMTRESDFGGYNYSFIINKDVFCDKVREALETQKTQLWPMAKNTNDFIIKKCNAKCKSDVTHEATQALMKDTDLLVQVKCKTTAIQNSKGASLGRGTIANILIDIFEYSYGKKEFICVRSHAERGCTVQVVKLVEYNNGPQYFAVENDSAVDKNALADVVNDDDDIAPF